MGKERAIVWFTSFINTFKKGSTKVVRPMAELAWFHRIVTEDYDKAIQIYEEILAMEFKDVDSENIDENLSGCRLELADLIFQTFRASSNPKEKLVLLEKMRKLPDLRTRSNKTKTANWNNWEESYANVMLALMTRTVSSPIKY